MPVTGQEAIAALPKSGWVREYVIHAMQQTNAPPVYHLGIGVTCLGVTTPLSYGLPFAGGMLRSNNYCLLVGRSGKERKTTSLNIGKRILLEAASPLVGSEPGSTEGLIEALERRPSQLIPMGEFGDFLSKAQGGYFEPIKTLITKAWDADPLERVKANNKVVRCENPRLSIGAASSISYLERYSKPDDWQGGFMGRWIILYGHKEWDEPYPAGNLKMHQWLVDQIQSRATMGSAGLCEGLDPSVEALWDEWYKDVNNRTLPETIAGLESRADTLCLKICLVYGWDFGPATRDKPWRITKEILEPAIALTELHLKSVCHLSEVIAVHPDARLRRDIIKAILRYNGRASMGQILGVLKMRKRMVYEMIDAMMEEGIVKRLKTTLGVVYELHSTTF